MKNTVVPFPTNNHDKWVDKLDIGMETLISVFEELHEVERMTGRTGLSSRVRLSIMGIMTVADRIAEGRTK